MKIGDIYIRTPESRFIRPYLVIITHITETEVTFKFKDRITDNTYPEQIREFHRRFRKLTKLEKSVRD